MSGEDWGHRKTMFTVAKLYSLSYSNSPICSVLPLWAEEDFQGESGEHFEASRDLVGSFLFTDSVDGNGGTKSLNVSSSSNPISFLGLIIQKCMETSDPAEIKRKSEGSLQMGGTCLLISAHFQMYISKNLLVSILLVLSLRNNTVTFGNRKTGHPIPPQKGEGRRMFHHQFFLLQPV